MSNATSHGVERPQVAGERERSRVAVKAEAYVALTKPRVIEPVSYTHLTLPTSDLV